MRIQLASAPDSWGVWFPEDSRQTPWNRFLDEVAQAGYEWIELGPYGYLPTNPSTLKIELQRRGLKACGTFIMRHLEDQEDWPQLEREVTAVSELLAELGARYVVLIDDTHTNLFNGESVRAARLDESGRQRLVDTTQRVARIVHQRFGHKLVVHPHADTHIEYEDQIEALLAATDPALVSLCLDTGHHAYAGGDPVAFLRKHHSRIPYLHLKNVDPEMQRRVKAQGIPFAQAVARDMFCEPSMGVVDFEALRDVLTEIDYQGFAVVEQDMFPAPFEKPLPIAKRTRDYLASIGLG
ncbi:MAG: sugar phosphate isomerase/epimerase [Acidobacteriota bacterium]